MNPTDHNEGTPTFAATPRPFVPVVRGPNWRPPPEKTAMFDHLGAGHGGMAFKPGDDDRLAILRRRLGDLTCRRVLEPGCGTGPLTVHLAAWVGPSGWVEAFDPSAGMLGGAWQRVGGLPNVRLTQQRCEEAEWPAGSFDLVLCFRVFPHFDDHADALDRLARWLAPGGRLLIVHWDGRDRLNALHSHCGPVEQDVFPPRAYLQPALEQRGFRVTAWIEDETEIYIDATRSA